MTLSESLYDRLDKIDLQVLEAVTTARNVLKNDVLLNRPGNLAAKKAILQYFDHEIVIRQKSRLDALRGDAETMVNILRPVIEPRTKANEVLIGTTRMSSTTSTTTNRQPSVGLDVIPSNAFTELPEAASTLLNKLKITMSSSEAENMADQLVSTLLDTSQAVDVNDGRRSEEWSTDFDSELNRIESLAIEILKISDETRMMKKLKTSIDKDLSKYSLCLASLTAENDIPTTTDTFSRLISNSTAQKPKEVGCDGGQNGCASDLFVKNLGIYTKESFRRQKVRLSTSRPLEYLSGKINRASVQPMMQHAPQPRSSEAVEEYNILQQHCKFKMQQNIPTDISTLKAARQAFKSRLRKQNHLNRNTSSESLLDSNTSIINQDGPGMNHYDDQQLLSSASESEDGDVQLGPHWWQTELDISTSAETENASFNDRQAERQPSAVTNVINDGNVKKQRRPSVISVSSKAREDRTNDMDTFDSVQRGNVSAMKRKTLGAVDCSSLRRPSRTRKTVGGVVESLPADRKAHLTRIVLKKVLV